MGASDPLQHAFIPNTNLASLTMMDSTTHSSTFRSSLDTDELRPLLLLTGVQVIVALLGAVLLTNGLLA